ncbi:dioscorin dioA3-like [Dioscorea cayenensis subsp. rotundata]|uniref:Dioscorin dioA3-like n=1 Tax=Dioscorea cayennensis subsp. rotundata TaxID=55577 RepID=A0AB40CJS6_DIOCR|nr:dioscorin dioA3-like [Dioscorea cayenensis subsp. rotundata]
MKKITMTSSTLLHLFLFSSLFFSWFPNAKPQGADIEDDFSYIEGSPNGPENWGNIKPEYATCGNGKEQSPVVLSRDYLQFNTTLGPLQRSYKATDAILKNRGYDIMLGWTGDAGSLVINETVYYLKQIHWHSPAEHATFDGTRYELESHLVHESEDQKIAVIGIFHKLGSPDPLLAELEDYIKQISTARDSEVNVGVVDPSIITIQDTIYYRYMGSLTTPPCTEGVVWTITNKFGSVSQSQIDLLKGAVDNSATNNSRPVQPINSRIIWFYVPSKSDA